ncbi:hypothetical protein CP556_21475 [Natrinema sp. CBA1119]|uniref:hypothetical protein n=1 Tax=Natrinema sp. CBA1119 TaxID=1608465 RepID=UPI000BF635C3|nr:hypothetical protein [Natrinema sp. CBA1119]PGF14332.1 hypothetical protein CP556_21730 [Natrinema sp. CBA1119]PGF14432.1 hypothetical protein CP556_21475 [Natrinema sp. CBA1119]
MDLADARKDVEYYKNELQGAREQLERAPNRQELKRAIKDLEQACERGDGNGVEVAVGRLKESAGSYSPASSEARTGVHAESHDFSRG